VVDDRLLQAFRNPDVSRLIERLAGELSLAEEPARFIAALEQPEPPGATT